MKKKTMTLKKWRRRRWEQKGEGLLCIKRSHLWHCLEGKQQSGGESVSTGSIPAAVAHSLNQVLVPALPFWEHEDALSEYNPSPRSPPMQRKRPFKLTYKQR